jgi:hypothetical protein
LSYQIHNQKYDRLELKEEVFIFKQTGTMVVTAIVSKFTTEWNKKHQTAKTAFLCLAADSCSCEK